MAGTERSNHSSRSHEGNGIRLARAVRRMADAHGLPNAFKLADVARETGERGINAMQVGKLCSSHFTRPMVAREFSLLGMKLRRIEKRSDGSHLIVEPAEDQGSRK